MDRDLNFTRLMSSSSQTPPRNPKRRDPPLSCWSPAHTSLLLHLVSGECFGSFFSGEQQQQGLLREFLPPATIGLLLPSPDDFRPCSPATGESSPPATPSTLPAAAERKEPRRQFFSFVFCRRWPPSLVVQPPFFLPVSVLPSTLFLSLCMAVRETVGSVSILPRDWKSPGLTLEFFRWLETVSGDLPATGHRGLGGSGGWIGVGLLNPANTLCMSYLSVVRSKRVIPANCRAFLASSLLFPAVLDHHSRPCYGGRWWWSNIGPHMVAWWVRRR